MINTETKYIIAGNWKMFKTVEESISFTATLQDKLLHLSPEEYEKLEAFEILLLPPYTALYSTKGISPLIKIGAQNLYYEEQGAFTGEISPLMLQGIADYVLIGHSERREIFKESDPDIHKKIKTALKFQFTPLLCVGETLEEREKGKTFSKVEQQLKLDLDGIEADDLKKIVFAYEPIWAIGTGKNATPPQAQEVHAFIREILNKKMAPKNNAESLKILYGGSVKPQNCVEILAQNDINGALIGGASLNVDDFFAIIRHSLKLANR